MTQVTGGKIKSSLAPCTSGATTETKNLLSYLCSLSGSPNFLIGSHDRYDLSGTAPGGIGAVSDFNAMTGEYPAYIHVEYSAPNQASANVTAANGSACYDSMRTELLAYSRRGGIIAVHDHWGNPTVSTGLKTAMSDVTTYTNRTGLPLASVKTGGAQEAQMLAYLADLATFFNSLIDDSGKKIPVIYRPMHEANISSFWWSGVDRIADYVLVWKKVVDYLKAAGVTNVLYSWCLVSKRDSETDNAVNPYSAWYPGDAYVDIVGLDFYNDGPVTGVSTFLYAGTDGFASTNAILTIAATAGKPFVMPEIGYQYAANGSDTVWERLGLEMSTVLRHVCMVGLWRHSWGPISGTVGGYSLGRAVRANSRIITLSRMTR